MNKMEESFWTLRKEWARGRKNTDSKSKFLINKTTWQEHQQELRIHLSLVVSISRMLVFSPSSPCTGRGAKPGLG